MTKIFYPLEYITKALPKSFFAKDLIKKGWSINRQLLKSIVASRALDKRQIDGSVYEIISQYKHKYKELLKEGYSKAEAFDEAVNEEALLKQRIENISVFDKVQDLKAEHEGEFYQWLPSEAKTANIEHQQLYGKIFKVGEGDIDGNMPGERWGCKCGIRFLGNTDSDNWEKADADDIRKTFKAERSLRKARAEAAEAHLKAAKEAEAADLLAKWQKAQKDAAQMALVSKIGEIEKRLAKQSEKINKLAQKAAKGNKTTQAPQKSQGGATNAPKSESKTAEATLKLPDKHIANKKPEFKEYFTERGKLKLLKDIKIAPTEAKNAVEVKAKQIEKAKEAIEKITGWTGVKPLDKLQFRYLYNSIKMVTDRASEMLEISGAGIKLAKNIKGFVFKPEKSVSFVNNYIQIGYDVKDWWQKYKALVKVGWFPKNTNAISLLIHEIGHSFEDGNSILLNKVVNDLFVKHKAGFKTIEDMKRSVSKYAARTYIEHLEWEHSEFFAESFSDWIKNGDKASFIAKELMQEWLKANNGKF